MITGELNREEDRTNLCVIHLQNERGGQPQDGDQRDKER
jgi:hypothetical protein